MTEKIKVIVAGAQGRMGRQAVKMVSSQNHFQLAGAIDVKNDGKKLSEIDADFHGIDCKIYTDVKKCILETNPDVLIDFTVPDAAYGNAKTALEMNVRPVVGTTGLSQEELDGLKTLANEKQIGCIVAPNFAIGAVLMMKFSKMAAKYFKDVEIIELHHDKKLDAPSGTAIKTAEMIMEVREPKNKAIRKKRKIVRRTGSREIRHAHP